MLLAVGAAAGLLLGAFAGAAQPRAVSGATSSAPVGPAANGAVANGAAANGAAANGAAANGAVGTRAPPPANPVEVTAQLSVAGGAHFEQPPRVPGMARPAFSLALRVDVLFGRAAPRTWGLGPFLSVRTDFTPDIAPALGASLLIPVSDTFPFVLSVAGVVRVDPFGVAPGVLERLWWGVRSHNHHGAYVLCGGLFVESRQFPGDPSAVADIVGGVDLDLELFAIPWIALYTWIARRDPGR